MSLTLIAPPADEPVSLGELKDHLRVTESAEDALIASLGAAARRAVEARAGLALMAQGWRLTLDRAPTAIMSLPRAPVLSLDDVSAIDRTGAATSIDPDLYDFESGPRARLITRGFWPPTSRRVGGIRIDFTAGWTDAGSVPEELKLAVKMLAAHFYENRESVAAERVFAAPQAVDALIGPWRRIAL